MVVTFIFVTFVLVKMYNRSVFEPCATGPDSQFKEKSSYNLFSRWLLLPLYTSAAMSSFLLWRLLASRSVQQKLLISKSMQQKYIVVELTSIFKWFTTIERELVERCHSFCIALFLPHSVWQTDSKPIWSITVLFFVSEQEKQNKLTLQVPVQVPHWVDVFNLRFEFADIQKGNKYSYINWK